uniref:TRAFD1/XAF1 zinc finger domain-containing protein n=1 Tax=Oryza barthii TaxID=65489 RepID=A0A0D3FIM4_9ORYZ
MAAAAAAATDAGSDPSAALAAAAAATSTCAHCQREIPSSNIDLHSAHCARNLQKCVHCGEMVARKLMDEHYNESHAPVNCTLCKEIVTREIWDLHKSEQCPQRIVACEYCEFELPAVELHEHQDVCGNRTEFCQTCKKYVRLREWIGHEIQCHANANANANASAQTSSARIIPEREVRPPPPVRPPRPMHGAQHKRLLFTIAVTGIAVMIGSILFQREESF